MPLVERARIGENKIQAFPLGLSILEEGCDWLVTRGRSQHASAPARRPKERELIAYGLRTLHARIKTAEGRPSKNL